ncbi:hypothetical protein ACJJTC_016779 [Scirpophaga incertulas]
MSLDPCYSRDKSPLKHNNESLIKDLVKKRGVVKGRLTKFSNYLSLLKSETMSTQSRIDLKLRVQGAANLFNEFNIIQNKLEELASDVDEQLTQREIFEDSYYGIMSQAEYLLNPNQVTDSSNNSHTSNTSSVALNLSHDGRSIGTESSVGYAREAATAAEGQRAPPAAFPPYLPTVPVSMQKHSVIQSNKAHIELTESKDEKEMLDAGASKAGGMLGTETDVSTRECGTDRI